MGLNVLRELHRDYYRKKYTSAEHTHPLPKYSDKTDDGLAKCIEFYCKFKGYHSERVSVTGRWKVDKYDKSKGRWIKASMKKGSADVHCIINGKPVMVEIKIGKDRQSPAQKKYEESVVRAKGIYIIVRNFAEFLEKIAAYE